MRLDAYDKARIRDSIARLMWYLPHDARRSLFLRSVPAQRDSFQAMRDHELGEVPTQAISLTGFDQLKCIFVHIPKCAGISVGRSLFGAYEGNHLAIPTYQMIYSKAEFDAYFKFAFVRNPWDRLLSAYSFTTADGDRNPDGFTPTVIDLGEEADWTESLRVKFGAKREVDAFPDFESFVKGWVTPRNTRVHEHYRPQYRFVCAPNGKLELDFVGRFETIDDDMAHICERLGVETTLVHHNRTYGEPRSYRDHYTPETRQIVEKIYAKDIEMFGYSFDDG